MKPKIIYCTAAWFFLYENRDTRSHLMGTDSSHRHFFVVRRKSTRVRGSRRNNFAWTLRMRTESLLEHVRLTETTMTQRRDNEIERLQNPFRVWDKSQAHLPPDDVISFNTLKEDVTEMVITSGFRKGRRKSFKKGYP